MYDITKQTDMPQELIDAGYTIFEDDHFVDLRFHGETVNSYSTTGLKEKHFIGAAWIHHYQRTQHLADCRAAVN